MEHQFRRGIYRPNAQRLSISLAPLVAQRSLLFRVKADLAGMQTGYGELTPTEDSPGLFALSATASAKVISAALSAMSTASVWSQDSWAGDASPFTPILAPVPVRIADTRRHAVAFSPSVQWEALSEEVEVEWEPLSDEPEWHWVESDRDSVDSSEVTTPLQSASSAGAAVVLPKEGPQLSAEIPPVSSFAGAEAENPRRKTVHEFGFPMKLRDLEGGPAAGKLRKKQKVTEENSNTISNSNANKRLSRSAKAFGKVMGHLSLQPSSKKESKDEDKEAAAAARRQTAVNIAQYKLPELKAGLSSPMRMSFIANGGSPPVLLGLPAPTKKQQQQRSTTPPPLLPPPPATPASVPMTMPSRKGHRRYNSSPAVPHFASTSFKGWDADDMPPVPQLPHPHSRLSTIPATPAAQTQTPRMGVRSKSHSISNWDVEREKMPPLPLHSWLPTIPATPAAQTPRLGVRAKSHSVSDWDTGKEKMSPVPLHSRLPTIPATPAALPGILTPAVGGARARSRSISVGIAAGGHVRAVSHPFPPRPRDSR